MRVDEPRVQKPAYKGILLRKTSFCWRNLLKERPTRWVAVKKLDLGYHHGDKQELNSIVSELWHLGLLRDSPAVMLAHVVGRLLTWMDQLRRLP